jgi:RHS repeat-associated protein
MNAAGTIATVAGVRQIFNYDAYGNAIGFNLSAAATTLLYSGQETDAATGLQYLRARYYSPSTATFTSLDPDAGEETNPLSYNKYLYAQADPVNGFDPSGREFDLTSLMATMTDNSSVESGDAGEAAEAYRAVQSIQNALDWYDRVTNLLRTLSDLQNFLNPGDLGAAWEQLKNSVAQMSFGALGALALSLKPGGLFVKIPVPSSAVNAVKARVGTMWDTNIMQEAIGVAGTLLFARFAGLKPTSFEAARQGIDFVMTTPGQMFAVVEAKGGTSTLNHSTGGQMGANWIQDRLRKAIQNDQLNPADTARLRAVMNTGPVFAAIVATNLKSNTSAYIAFQVQVYKGPSRQLTWNSIFG